MLSGHPWYISYIFSLVSLVTSHLPRIQEEGLDVEKAFDWLRKKGQASMAKRDRATKVREKADPFSSSLPFHELLCGQHIHRLDGTASISV